MSNQGTAENNPGKEVARSVEDIHRRLYKACNLLEILKGIDANEDTFNMGHEEIIKIIDDSLQGTFDPINDIFKALDIDLSGDERVKPARTNFTIEGIEKLDQEFVDLALQIQSMDEEARNNTIASIHAIKRREARGGDLEPQDYESLCEERGDNLQSCIRTLEEIRAIADLLTVSAGSNDPLFFDDTLENIGCLITDRVKATMDIINAEPVVSEEEHGGR